LHYEVIQPDGKSVMTMVHRARVVQVSSDVSNGSCGCPIVDFKPLCHFASNAKPEKQPSTSFATVDSVEKANVWLCEECHHSKMKRREARLQGRQKCELCGGVAYSPVPTLRSITYACCDCRIRFERIFFALCAMSEPALLEQSRQDIFYFDSAATPRSSIGRTVRVAESCK
jgi:hypothetical protein